MNNAYKTLFTFFLFIIGCTYPSYEHRPIEIQSPKPNRIYQGIEIYDEFDDLNINKITQLLNETKELPIGSISKNIGWEHPDDTESALKDFEDWAYVTTCYCSDKPDSYGIDYLFVKKNGKWEVRREHLWFE